MKIDQRQMEAIMKKMGIKSEQISAKEVLIKGEKNYVIKKPQVIAIDMAGQKSFQITGEIEELKDNIDIKTDIDEEDVKLVMEKTKVSRDKAIAALKESEDIAEAILKLS